MKIYSWNVNGIRAIQKKGFKNWIFKEKPDILCIQETKAHENQLDEELLDFYQLKDNGWINLLAMAILILLDILIQILLNIHGGVIASMHDPKILAGE